MPPAMEPLPHRCLNSGYLFRQALLKAQLVASSLKTGSCSRKDRSKAGPRCSGPTKGNLSGQKLRAKEQAISQVSGDLAVSFWRMSDPAIQITGLKDIVGMKSSAPNRTATQATKQTTNKTDKQTSQRSKQNKQATQTKGNHANNQASN